MCLWPAHLLSGRSLPQLSRDLARLKEHYERRVRELVASTVAAVEMQQLRHKHELKVAWLRRPGPLYHGPCTVLCRLLGAVARWGGGLAPSGSLRRPLIPQRWAGSWARGGGGLSPPEDILG